MALSEDPDASRFVGRTSELRLAAERAAEASRAHPWVISVEGPAGVGKTSFVRAVCAGLDASFTMARIDADELALDQPMELVKRIVPTGESAPFAAGMALLGHLNGLQDRGPVALVIEDLHWADLESRQALLVALRRLDRDRVLTVVTIRPDEFADDSWHRLLMDPARCQRIALGGFSWSDCAELAASFGVELNRSAAQRIVDHTAGLPLYVRTLLMDADLRSFDPAAEHLPVPRSLGSTIVGRLGGLSMDARTSAAALAVLAASGDVRQLAVMAPSPAPTAVVDELIAAGLVRRLTDGRDAVEFAHPLFRTAIYEDLPQTRRVELHRAAVGVTTGGERLLHRVAAATVYDPALADDLVSAALADMAARRYRAAGKQFLRAVDVDNRPAQREQGVLAAADAYLRGHHYTDLEYLLPRVEACAASATRSRILGAASLLSGDSVQAERHLLDAIDGPDATPVLAARCWLNLGTLFVAFSRGQEAVVALERALQAELLGSSETAQAEVQLAIATSQIDGAVAGLAVFDRFFRRAAPGDRGVGARVSLARSLLEFYALRFADAAASCRLYVDGADGVATGHLSRAHALLAACTFELGDWDEAALHASTSVALATDEGEVLLLAQGRSMVARLAASRGDFDRATANLDAAWRASRRAGTPEADLWTRLAQAALHTARREPAAVLEALLPLETAGDDRGFPRYAVMWWPIVIGAFIDLGDRAAADAYLTRLAVVADRDLVDLGARRTALKGRLAVLEGDTQHAISLLEEAAAMVGPHEPVLSRADLHRRLGRLLAQTDDRRRARDHFHQSLGLLHGVGARPFLDELDHDLTALRMPRDVKARPGSGLTEREEHVVTLAVQGHTNKEIAGALYVSTKAVEYHMSNILAKLGLTSRRELRTLNSTG